MNVAMMQPSFIPWQGFFELIYKSDIFIFLDDFQFSKQSYHQRNRLFVDKEKTDWYTVPIQKSTSFKLPLNQTKINETTFWRKKMWNRIQYNYSKTPFYADIVPYVKKLLLNPTESLSAYNINFIMFICDVLGIKREFRFSSQYLSKLHRSEHVLELLKWCHTNTYYSAYGSFMYMFKDSVFPISDITVLFQDFHPKPYTQVRSETFISHLSVLDALMNIGAESTSELIKNGTQKWLTWDEMTDIYSGDSFAIKN